MLAKKVKELRPLVQYLFSVGRLKKIFLIVREQLTRFIFLFRNNSSAISDLPPDPEKQVWTSHESRAIDRNYFEQGWRKAVEDQCRDDGLVHAELDYTVQLLHGASSYHNGSTHRSVFNQHGVRQEVLSSERASSKKLTPSKRSLTISKRVPSVTANLFGNLASAEGNYFHWFVDTLPRLFLIERFHSRENIDQVLVPPLKYDFQWESLKTFGFEPSQIIQLNPLECLEFDTLLASSPPRGKGSSLCPGWVIDRYCDTLVNHAKHTPSVAGKQVYISRRDAPARMFYNEDAVCERLESLGFNVVELTPLNLRQKIAVFRDADVIISQTGAGLTNLIFAPAHVKMIELVDEKFVYPLFASLAVYKGGSHHAHFFSDDNALARANAVVAKSTLNIEELEDRLKSI